MCPRRLVHFYVFKRVFILTLDTFLDIVFCINVFYIEEMLLCFITVFSSERPYVRLFVCLSSALRFGKIEIREALEKLIIMIYCKKPLYNYIHTSSRARTPVIFLVMDQKLPGFPKSSKKSIKPYIRNVRPIKTNWPSSLKQLIIARML